MHDEGDERSPQRIVLRQFGLFASIPTGILEYRVLQFLDLTSVAYTHLNLNNLSRYVTTSTFAYRLKFHKMCSL